MQFRVDSSLENLPDPTHSSKCFGVLFIFWQLQGNRWDWSKDDVALQDLCGSVTSHLVDSPLLRTEIGEIHESFFREILTGNSGEN